MSNHNVRTAGPEIRVIVCAAALCVAMLPVAHGQPAGFLSVQPASIHDGTIGLYGIIRRMPGLPLEEGTVFAVQVTAAHSGETTAPRRQAAGRSCPTCTTTHYFLAGAPGDKRPEMLVRLAPGPVTYIHIKGREYMLAEVRLSWTGEGEPRLARATLWQTGFTLPFRKRRIRIDFDASTVTGTLADEVARMALADAGYDFAGER